MEQSIILIILIIYFIRQQFNFNKVKKVTYFFLPLLSLYSFITSFSISKRNFIALLIITVSSLFIGYFQSSKSVVRSDSVPVYYFYDDAGKEHEIYKKIVKVKGGRYYLIGWIGIFILQILIQIMITRSKISSGEIIQDFTQDIIEAILDVYQLFGLQKNQGSWYVWALYGISSLSYTYFLTKKSPMVRSKLFASKQKYDYDLEEYSDN